MKCGRGSHLCHQCPAKDVQCHKCKHKENFAVECRCKTVAEVSDIPLPEQDYYDIANLYTLGLQNAHYWTCGIQVNGQYVSFKVDTGAEVTVISEDASRALGLNTLQPSTKKLHGPDHSPLKVVGHATVRLADSDKQCTHVIFVLQKGKHNLLGLPAIQALKVLTQVNTVSRSVLEQTPIPDQYPSLFKGLGTFKGDSYAIQLKPDAKTICSVHSAQCAHSPEEEGEGGIVSHAIPHITHQETHTVVCRDGCSTKTVRCSQNLC